MTYAFLNQIPLAIAVGVVVFVIGYFYALRMVVEAQLITRGIDPVLLPTINIRDTRRLFINYFPGVIIVLAYLCTRLLGNDTDSAVESIIVMSVTAALVLLVFFILIKESAIREMEERQQEALDMTSGPKFVGKLTKIFWIDGRCFFELTASGGETLCFLYSIPFPKQTDGEKIFAVFYRTEEKKDKTGMVNLPRRVIHIPPELEAKKQEASAPVATPAPAPVPATSS